MKNLRFNNRTLSLFFSLLFIVIFGCTEKEILEPEVEELQVIEQQEVVKVNDRVTTLDHKEIPEVMDGLLSKLGKTGKTILNGKLSHNNVDIDLREIKAVVNKGTNVNYSFAMDVKGRPNHIFNLIVTRLPDGTIQDPKVIGYHMKPKDMEAFFKSGEDYRNFITDYKYYKYDSFFADTKFGLVGKSGDCGGGSTGGSGGSSSPTAPGGTFTHSYDGHTVTNVFSSDAVNISYGYTSNIRTQNNTQLSTVDTKGWSKGIQISTPGITGVHISYNVAPGTVSIGTTSDAGASGPGDNCLTINTLGDTWMKRETIPCFGPQQKTASTAMTGDCTSPDGTFAINTAAKAVSKLDYHLPGGLNAGQFGWFSDSNYPNRKYIAQNLVWFLLDNGKSDDSIIFVILAVDALVKGGNVDVEERIIENLKENSKEKCVHDKMKNLEGNFIAGVLSNFNGSSEFDVVIKSEPSLPNNANGNTRYSGGKILEIRISTANSNTNSALKVASTILHEYIHAEMFRKINTSIALTSPMDINFLNTYNSYKNNGFEPKPQHETMAKLYVNSMAEGLQTLHKQKMKADFDAYTNHFGEEPSSDFYRALAWQSLKEVNTTAWNELSSADKMKYSNLMLRIGILTNSCN